MARALIVACGCRGRELGAALLERGWQVRGTTRSEAGVSAIEGAGIEAVVADPDRVGSVVELLEDVALVVWALGSADGDPGAQNVNGPRLESMLERMVDTPVRGFVFDGAGTVAPQVLRGGSALVREAGERWRIPVAVVTAEPGEWAAAVVEASESLLGL